MEESRVILDNELLDEFEFEAWCVDQERDGRVFYAGYSSEQVN